MSLFMALPSILRLARIPKSSIRLFHPTFLLNKDYYSVLGINKSASQSEIKKAYYQLLGDDERRKQYDRFGSTTSSQGGFGGGQQSGGFEFHSNINPEDLFRRIFRDSEFSFKEWSTNDKGFAESIFGFDTTKEVVVNLSFEEAARGINKEITANMLMICSRCGGSRAEPGTGTSTCPNCRGSGTENMNTGPFLLRTVCRRCHGTGTIVRNPCGECDGHGKMVGRHKVKVSIPAGVEDGQVLRVSIGGGDFVASQELFVQIKVEKSRQFKREGADVHSDIIVSIAQATLGGKVRFQGIYESMLVNIPLGSCSHDRIRIPGKGMVRMNGHGYGDHYIHVYIRSPKRLTELQRALLLAYAETEKEVSGTIEGVTSTDKGLHNLYQNLHSIFGCDSNSSKSSSGHDTQFVKDEMLSNSTNERSTTIAGQVVDVAKQFYQTLVKPFRKQ